MVPFQAPTQCPRLQSPTQNLNTKSTWTSSTPDRINTTTSSLRGAGLHPLRLRASRHRFLLVFAFLLRVVPVLLLFTFYILFSLIFFFFLVAALPVCALSRADPCLALPLTTQGGEPIVWPVPLCRLTFTPVRLALPAKQHLKERRLVQIRFLRPNWSFFMVSLRL